MHIPTLLLVAVSLSCTSLPRASAVSELQDDLPPATEGLALPAFEAEGVTLADLVREFARVTNQNIVMTEDSRARLQLIPVVVGETGEIPPAEVYAFVEGLLCFHGFYTAQLKGGDHPLLGIYSGFSGRDLPLAPRKTVRAEDLNAYSDHPAFLIQTVVELPHVDVRQLATSMRAILRDTSSQTLLSVGDHGVALAGTGQWVADIARVMLEVDDQSRIEQAHPVPEPEEKDE